MSVTDLPVSRGNTPDEHEISQERQRWQPHRAGIFNVWRYYDETFTFHEGCLLLRGQNGTGKSKALELLLPFLFDASLRPNRLSTFGGSERTMHWNLMGEGASGKTRVGYVWMEFGRTSESGEEQWFSCGARLQASVHTTAVHADYFTTTQRIAQSGGLFLVNDTDQPLTRAALAEALQGHGEVYSSATDYRTTVRRTLFAGMGEQRYEALITALLQLRQPKLSERLDPSLLSSLLSRALPPLGEGEITELAEGFERLDRQREQLRQLDEEVSAAESVASRQRSYAQRVLRSGAAKLISATTDMDNLTRVARESTEQHEQAQRDQHATELQRDELQQRADELEAGIEGLKESDVYKQGEELDQLRRSFEQSARRAKRLRETADAKQLQAGEDEQHAAEAAARAQECADRAREASEDAHRAARTAGLESVYQEAKTMIGTPSETSESVGDDQVARSRHLVRGAVEARRGQIVEVGTAIGQHDRALSDRAAAEASLDEARDRLADAVHRRDEAIRVYEEALTKQAQLLREWAAGCVELCIDDVEALVSLTAVEDDVASLVDSAMRSVVGEIADREARTDTARGAALDERGTLTETIEALRREADLPPTAPPTRTTDRSTIAGAPLWRLVAFHDDVPVDVQAGVEAALEASGLLDAWVKPDDEVVLPGHDTWVESAWAVPAPGASLLDVLRPEADIPVPTDLISRLLGSISYGPRLPNEHLAAVGADGSWRLASATGTWVKEEPAHIGSLARERARRRRIDQLTERLTEVNSTIATCDAQMRECRERRNRLDADLSARPRYRDLNEKRRLWDRAEEGIGVRDDALRAAAKLLEEREADVTKSLRQLSRLSAEYGLPTDRGLLKDLSSAVDTFRDMADAWADACLRWSADVERSTSAGSQAARSLAAAQEHAEEAETAESESSGLRAKLEAVESTVGEDFRQVAARIHEMREEHRRSRDNVRLRNEELRALDQRIGRLQTTMAQDAEERDKAISARDAAAQRFRHLSLLGLPEDAGVSVELTAQDGTRATLESARSVAAKWPNVPHEPRNVSDAATRLLETVYEARPLLGQRTDLDLEPDEDIQVFAATMDGVRVGATGLLRILTAERDSSRDDITTAERRLFDQTLTGDTRRHLAARIRQANELVDRMNRHLERVRTASNIAVQLVWHIHPDLPPSTRTARELLLKDPGRVTDADREALHSFFRSRIEEAKARNTAATWEEQLSEVLDYTAWHQFVVKLDRANGHGWQLLTKKMHGALSGGEKAIALHLPLFAAVAAHYEAVPEAPRPILLDEVFVGVDTVNRGQVFALLSALDLDLMLTSDHEWATYRELAGIAVHQLITGADGDDAVTSARFIWDGNGLEPDETEEVPA